MLFLTPSVCEPLPAVHGALPCRSVQALLLQSLRLLLSLPPDVVLPLSNRLASGLLILIQVCFPTSLSHKILDCLLTANNI